MLVFFVVVRGFFLLCGLGFFGGLGGVGHFLFIAMSFTAFGLPSLPPVGHIFGASWVIAAREKSKQENKSSV